jgi:ribose/xylose/arabinose/galactoside ABC-type transport system permease subunit
MADDQTLRLQMSRLGKDWTELQRAAAQLGKDVAALGPLVAAKFGTDLTELRQAVAGRFDQAKSVARRAADDWARTLRFYGEKLAHGAKFGQTRFGQTEFGQAPGETLAALARRLGSDLTRLPQVAAALVRAPGLDRIKLGRDLSALPLPVKSFIATALLVLIGGIAAPSTVTSAAILSTLPYFAILAVASIGQHLVIQQRGLDLSTAGIMSFTAVVVTKLPDGSTVFGVVIFYIAAALAVGAGIGAMTGVIVTLLEVPPLVTTIGVNAILFGLTYYVSTGASVQSPPMMVEFFVSSFLFVPTMVWVLLLVAGTAVFVLIFTTIGRRFIAVSVNPAAAHAVGVPLNTYSIATYTLAGFIYAVAAIMLSGYLVSPTVLCGLPYLLGTIAAVVVGGNPLGGVTKASVVATVIGAFFLTYLAQLVTALGFGGSAEDLADAIIVLSGVALPEITRRLRYA